MLRTLIVSLSFLLAACAGSEAPDCPFTGVGANAPSAGCLVSLDGRILLVENGAGKVSPPGGKTQSGESAQCAAHRETFEETGLDLAVGPLLMTFDTGFNLYRCEIHENSGEITLQRPMEVSRAYWLLVQDVERVRWRYPGQGEILRDLLQRQNKGDARP
ncbi:MAG: NUDIX domain-containing protein [Pseudomonadota bacterium]